MRRGKLEYVLSNYKIIRLLMVCSQNVDRFFYIYEYVCGTRTDETKMKKKQNVTFVARALLAFWAGRLSFAFVLRAVPVTA